jgi:LysM repeat protein
MSTRNKKFELSPRLRLGVGRGYTQNQILKASAGFCLILAVILTANSVRLLFNNNTQDIQQTQVLGASDTKIQPINNGLEFTNYTVQKGDTLFNVSQKFNIDWSTLAVLNNLKSPFVLKPGQIINIPK